MNHYVVPQSRPMKIFGLNGSRVYAEKICEHLGVILTPHEEKYFEDGEAYLKPVDGDIGNVRGHDVFVIQSLYSSKEESVNDKLMKLFIMVGALQDASAANVIAVIPHKAYARQDRKTASRAPVTTKTLARMLKSAGVSHILMFDAHNLAAEQNAFQGVAVDNLESKRLIAQWIAAQLIQKDIKKPVVVLSPDAGGYARADRFRYTLEKVFKELGFDKSVGIAIFDKLRRINGVQGGKIVGDVEGAWVIALDDMISTGGTMYKAEQAVAKHGGDMFAIAATHGLFVGEANTYFRESKANIVVTDTVDPFRLDEENSLRLTVIDTTEMMARAIERINSGVGSISSLLK